MNKHSAREKETIPEFLKPLLWSYDFTKLDPQKNKKQIIINTINYGGLKHWRWILSRYGRDDIRDVLRHAPSSAIRTRARRLASLMFHFPAKESLHELRSIR